MTWFYTYVYPYWLYVFLATLAAMFVGRHYARQRRFRPAKYLHLASFALDLIMVGIYGASFAYKQYAGDALLAVAWCFLAVLSFKSYIRSR